MYFIVIISHLVGIEPQYAIPERSCYIKRSISSWAYLLLRDISLEETFGVNKQR